MVISAGRNVCRRLFAKPGGFRAFSVSAAPIGVTPPFNAGALIFGFSVGSMLGGLLGRLIFGPPRSDKEIAEEVLSQESFRDIYGRMKEMGEAERIKKLLLLDEGGEYAERMKKLMDEGENQMGQC